VNEVTIITPCSRPKNLPLLFESLEFSLIKNWLIVYDSTKRDTAHQFKHPKIIEYNEERVGFSGNTQRNRGIQNTHGGLIYFLDDDNVIHPHFWNILPGFSNEKLNLFQIEGHPKTESLNLRNPGPGTIDTSMYCVDRKLVGNTRWLPHLYAADGVFAETLYCKKPNSLKIFDEKAAYYNYLSRDKKEDSGKCPSTSAMKTANVILANQDLYSPETVKTAHFALSLPKNDILNENFSYAQIRYLAEEDDELEILKKKKILIRGAGLKGRNDLIKCKDFGIETQGFLVSDQSKEVGMFIDGLQVFPFNKKFNKEKCHVLISSTFFASIEIEMIKLGWKIDKDYTILF
jgi:glycosyltransferase involved in cell wall biosynthesis